MIFRRALLFFLIPTFGWAQNANDKNLVQFSGVIVSAQGLKPVSFTSIMIKNSHRGTICDYYGYFSLVAEVNDTIQFRSLGFRTAEYLIPDTLETNRYSMIQMLYEDTIELPEAMIFPWPTKDQFKKAFLETQIPDDDLVRAQKNLDPKTMATLSSSLPMGSGGNYTYQMQQYQTKIYNAGMARNTTNLLNPIAWAKFIQAWQNGDFKSQK
jgi:hypothetical protein|tara:strand:+ start:9583 stop:10215 length:633 start_codon:yes stop_codon:yes gene_type:complete